MRFLAVKAMIMNNHHLGMVSQWQDDFYAQNYCATYLGKTDEVDYPMNADIAKAFGIPSKRVSKPADLKKAIELGSEIAKDAYAEGCE